MANIDLQKPFKDSEMFAVLSNFIKNSGLDFDITPYESMCPFWRIAEQDADMSYMSYIQVLVYENEHLEELITKRKSITRRETNIFKQVVNDVVSMLYTPIKDEEAETEEETCFICATNKACRPTLCCNNSMCNFCTFRNKELKGKCPFCRSLL